MQPANVLKFLMGYGLLENAQLDGDQVKILCPFHHDSNPSCGISLSKFLFHCFSCSEGGDMLKLITRLEELAGRVTNPLEAMLIAEGVKDVQTSDVRTTKANIYINYNIINNYIVSQDKENKLEQRKTAYRFYKSLATVNWYNHIDNYMVKNREYTPDTLNHFRLKINRVSHNPIVIPLLEGKSFKGYVARRIDSVKEKKYKNSTGLEKKSILIGDLTPDKPILVVEGMLDAMSSYQLGYKNCAPLLGCEASDYQLDRLASLSPVIVWATDNDEAGIEGYAKALAYYRKKRPHVSLRRFAFPAGINDVGEMLPHGQDFRKILKSAIKLEYLGI